MMNGINGSSGYASQMQMQGMQKRQGQAERFNKLDSDGNGTINQAELQTMGDKFSEITGQQINVAEVSDAHDANNDGLLDKNEMQSMMMELRGSMGGLQGGGPPSQQLLSAYQAESEKDLTSTLLDMLGESDDKQDEEEEAYNPLDVQV